MKTLLEKTEIKKELYFDEEKFLHDLHHFLPSQNPLKDFVHHNSLHAFQEYTFHEAIRKANTIFGYKGYLQLQEYRNLYFRNRISPEDLIWSITKNKGADSIDEWKEKMIYGKYDENTEQRIGQLRGQWKSRMRINMDKEVFPLLIRVISNYLDQGIGIWNFPNIQDGYLSTIRYIVHHSTTDLIKTEKARELLFSNDLSIHKLLSILIGKEEFFAYYLFDQQFSHPGWSGMIAVLERNPELLYNKRKITLREFIIVELLLELDVLYSKYSDVWSPLGYKAELKNPDLFAESEYNELFDIYKLWLDAYEWNFYKQALAGLKKSFLSIKENKIDFEQKYKFQAFFCIDDRSCSIRRYIEMIEKNCQTFGTPGHFNIIAYYKPEKAKFLIKIHPVVYRPKHIIVEKHKNKIIEEDTHFSKKTHSALWGWILTQTLGFLSGLNLFRIIVKPSVTSGTNYSFHHMHADAQLEIDYQADNKINSLQTGFTFEEMAAIVAGILQTTGLVKNFAPLVYFIGHGSSSTNNPYYAAYGCGACYGRPGSVNARAAANMANKKEVRQLLKNRGIDIPDDTQFLGALHDTTRDEIVFYDENILSEKNTLIHQENIQTFRKALLYNAEERARRFQNISLKLSREKIYEKVKQRSVALFEIRPEYNHATNALFIIGRRDLTKNLFLDRRAFLNSYNYLYDKSGELLEKILSAAVGVVAGINLEYYFSRVSSERLGAGSKLPQNIIGLLGIANGTEGDLRTGLPYQMVEIHDPIRALTIIEQYPEVVEKILNNYSNIKKWYSKNWMNLIVMHPESGNFFIYDFKYDRFLLLQNASLSEPQAVRSEELNSLMKSTSENLPIMQIEN